MNTVAIVGAGTMGGGIAHVAALAGYPVLLHDVSDDILKNSLTRISRDMQKGVEKGKLSPQQVSDAIARIHVRTTLDSFESASVVIEAAREDLEVKRELLARLEATCASTTIFASNTSSLSITEIAARAQHPERIVGMHFFNPAHLMKLVEVVRGHRTSDAVVSETEELAKTFGKVPVLVQDTPGFIVNRCARPFYGEALRLLSEGVASVEDIDRIVRLEGGFRMGPFELMDLIGIDINLAVTRSIFEQTFGEPRYRPHIIQRNMVNANLLGRKTQRGFYDYRS